MKRMVALLVCLVLILAVFPTSKVQADNIPLSQMSDEEILAFLDTYEIAIPDAFTESDSALAARIRKWITEVESNPNIEFMYSHTDLHNVAYAIKNAVNRYYGYTSSESKATRSLNYTLQYSTLYEVPANMTLFNCYSYAIGISSAWYNPGAFYGYTLTENDLATMFVDDIADLVIADFHDYGTPIYTGYNYHSGTKHYYQYSKTCSTCGLATTYYTSTSCLDCGGATVRP